MTVENTRLARAALTRLMEPSDLPGLALVKVLGPWEAMRVITGHATIGTDQEEAVADLLNSDAGIRWTGFAEHLDRWRPRLPDLAAARDLQVIARLGGGLLIPEDPHWPAAVDDLGLRAPLALWFRGSTRVPAGQECVSVVGARESSNYGESVAAELCQGLAMRGKTVISGGAYGIDATAHRAALVAAPERSITTPVPGMAVSEMASAPAGQEPPAPATVAVMAGGLDRFYPAGNEALLREIAARGLLIAEVPPGTNPTRYRFLQRNRLIAALSAATVVVEARWRSGALSTAHHAVGLGRQLGAVPGSVYSAGSAGCHRLLREGAAVCVTDTDEVLELVSPMGALAPERHTPKADHDGLVTEDLLLLDALPVRNGASAEKLMTVAGLGSNVVQAGLGRLELLGLARRTERGWARSKPQPDRGAG